MLELVEGPTLADRIKQGPIPVDEALPIAKQIAEALEAAHEAGVIHRDLKPANVKLRPDGTVKVLDFGLAKALEPAGVSPSVSQSPTITTPAMTQAGMVLGIAAYMSPERASGHAVDGRSDVWALGCVLYEMLTAARAFDAERVAPTLARVLERDPDWSLLPSGVTPTLLTDTRRCLHKNPKQRVGTVQDVRLALEGAFDTAGVGAAAAAGTAQSSWRRVLPLTTPSVTGGLVAALAAWSLWPAPEPGAVSRFDYDLPSGQAFRGAGRRFMVLSPDGRHFVYNTLDGLYLRTLGDLEPRLVTGEDLRGPFFSPDGEWIGYWSTGDDQLKKIAVTGGTAVSLASMANPFGASWGPDGTIVYAQRVGIWQVSENGGTPVRLLETEEGERADGPEMLPGGNAVLFSVTTAAGARRWDEAQIVVYSLDSGERMELVEGGSEARYVPIHLSSHRNPILNKR